MRSPARQNRYRKSTTPPGKSPSRWFVTTHSSGAASVASTKVRVNVNSAAAVRRNVSTPAVPRYYEDRLTSRRPQHRSTPPQALPAGWRVSAPCAVARYAGPDAARQP